MFVFTVSDAIGLVVFCLLAGVTIFLTANAWLRQVRCTHDGGVNETTACDAIYRKCGRNLGFIGTWRENNRN